MPKGPGDPGPSRNPWGWGGNYLAIFFLAIFFFFAVFFLAIFFELTRAAAAFVVDACLLRRLRRDLVLHHLSSFCP